MNEIFIQQNINLGNNKFEDFYDVIIDIKSIKDINEGWKIKMNEKGEKKYKEFKNNKKDNDVIKIGIIGNANKGKSFYYLKYQKLFYHQELV